MSGGFRDGRLEAACRVALAATVLGLPFEFYFLERRQSLATSLKLELVVFLALWLALVLLRARRDEARAIGRELATLLPRRLQLALIAFLAVQGLAAALAPELRGNAAKAAVKWWVGAAVLVATADLARRAGARLGTRLMMALALAGSLTAALGVGDRLGLDFCRRVIEFFQPELYWEGDLTRLSSTMEYPTTAASFLTASLLASVALVSQQLGPAQRRLPAAALGGAAVLQGVALALTFSLGAAFSAAVALAAAAWLGPRILALPVWRYAAAGVIGSFLVVQGLLLFLAPGEPPLDSASSHRRIARFGHAAIRETMDLEPGREYRETISVRNESSRVWRRDGFGVGYRWYSIARRERSLVREAAMFREDLAPGQERRLEARLQTPAEEGEYLLIWFVVHRDPDLEELPWSFAPAILCRIGPAGSPPQPWSARARDDLTAIRAERNELPLDLVPSRWDLWRAALRMFHARPLLGIGPDNFRLLKWKYMDIPKGDDTILANSLYLEFLACSGLVGFLSLGWLLLELGLAVARRSAAALSPAEQQLAWFGVAFLASFLAHGTVDYFLKFTPTFLLFWIVMGVAAADAHRL
jgi:hypothetical protein